MNYAGSVFYFVESGVTKCEKIISHLHEIG